MKPINLEDLLRERLGAGSSRALPSPGFEDRVRLSLTPRGSRSRRRAHTIEAPVGFAVVVALAVVALPWLIGPRSGVDPGAGGDDASPSATPEPTLAPTATPTSVPLAHAQKWFISFDYPAAWSLTDRNVPSLGIQPAVVMRSFDAIGVGGSLGFVGTGTADESCQIPAPNSGPKCATTWTLPEGSVMVRFWIDQAASRWSGQQAIEGVQVPGMQSVIVDGLPSLFAKTNSDLVPNPNMVSPTDFTPFGPEHVAGADEVLWWALPTQLGLQQSYIITAAIRGPNAAELEAQVRALVASIHWVPEPYVLPTGPALNRLAEAAVPTALAELRASVDMMDETQGAFDCFPTTLGTSVKTTIVHDPQDRPLTKPLPVTCTSRIAPNVMQGWTLTLTQTWVAGPDYPAGIQTFVFYLDASGHMIGTVASGYGLPTYPHQTGSKYPG